MVNNDITILQSKQNSLNTELNSLQSDIQILNEKKCRLERAKNEITAKIQEFQTHKQAFSKIHIESNKWRGKMEGKFSNAYYDRLIPELSKYVQKIHVTRDDLDNDIKGIESKISNKQNEVSSTKSEIAILKSEISIKKRKEADKK